MFIKRMKKLLLLIAIFSALAAGALTPMRVQAAVFNVTKTVDTNDGSCTVADCSLREAVVAANASAGPHTINVPAGTYTLTIVGAGEEDAATGDLDINEDITITGAGAATTIINGGGIDRVLDLDPYDTSRPMAISGMTITNGSVSGPGGGVYVNASGCPDVTLTNIVITANAASSGGGVSNQGCGSLTIANSTISGNTAIGGGGIASTDALTLTNVTVSGNTTTDSDGAGIHINSPGNTTTITNSTISGNDAVGNGGGIFFDNYSDLQILNSTISGNSSAGFGGGIFNGNYGSATPLLLSYSTITNNNAYYTGSGIYGDFILDLQLNIIPSNTAFGNTIVANNTGGNCAGAGIRTSNGNNLDSANTCGFASGGDLINIDPLLGALANNGGPTFTHALLTGSPAIDAGNNTGCPATDQRGYSRSGNCDIGAYEFVGAGGNTPPPGGGGSDEAGGGGCGSGSSGGSNCSGDSSSSVCSQMSNKRKNNQQPFSGALMLLAPLTWLLFRRAVRKMLNAHTLQVSRP